MKTRLDSLADAADLALLGIATAVAALPIVTAGAAVAAASAAVRDRCATGSLPGWRTTGSRFWRGVVPGSGATAVGLACLALVVIDFRALARGLVPGGGAMIAATAAVVLLLCGVAGLVLIEVGRREGRAWTPALRAALTTAWLRPGRVALAGGIGLLATLLALAVPVTAPLVLGCYLFALHAWAQV